MSSAPVSRSPRSAESPAERKATLFCQECGHTNPVDGDWCIRTVGGHRRVRCPDCRRVVDDRRVADGPRSDATTTPVTRYAGALGHYLSAWAVLFDGESYADC